MSLNIEWTNAITLEFLELYEKHPVLWSPQHVDHKNRGLLNDAWLSIKENLSVPCTIEGLRKKKESLMATYRNLQKKKRLSESSGSGASEVYNPSWFAYNAINRFYNAATIKTFSLNSEDIQGSEDILSGPLLSPLEDNNEPLFIDNEGESDKSRANKRKRHYSMNSTEINKNLQEASTLIKTHFSQKATSSTHKEDAWDIAGRGWVAKIRLLPKTKRLRMGQKIENMLYEALLEDACAIKEKNCEEEIQNWNEKSEEIEYVENASTSSSITDNRII